MPEIKIGSRRVGPEHPPLVIADIGINHEGSLEKAVHMVEDAAATGCECVKFQCHIVDDEMIPNDVVPDNANESIWDIMSRCALSESDERVLKDLAESKGMIFLSTPFSRAAAVRLQGMDVLAFKIGSGECNNYPLVEHIAGYGKPVFLSTGMNDLESMAPAVDIIRSAGLPYALLHCTSMYPTPHDKVRLGALDDLAAAFPDAVIGYSDHTKDNYSCFAAAALGASILERHFTSNRSWPGPDVPISMDPDDLGEMIAAARAIHAARGGRKDILPGEQPTIDFAYACVVTTRKIGAGEAFDAGNIWVKRPGTGEILARDYPKVLGRQARRSLEANVQVAWEDVGEP